MTVANHPDERVVVCRAQDLGLVVTRPLLIQIGPPVPEMPLASAEGFYRRQAARLADALQRLPGGTLHQLRIELLRRLSVLWRVPEPQPDYFPPNVRRRATHVVGNLRHMVALDVTSTIPGEVPMLATSQAMRDALDFLDECARDPAQDTP